MFGDGSSRGPMMAFLPREFVDLERWISWALPTETMRNVKRMASDYNEIKEFYEAMHARIEAAIDYLDRVPAGKATAADDRLCDLVFALAEIAPAVEFYGQPQVFGGFVSARMVPVEIFPKNSTVR